jgi:hypothetical protein
MNVLNDDEQHPMQARVMRRQTKAAEVINADVVEQKKKKLKKRRQARLRD